MGIRLEGVVVDLDVDVLKISLNRYQSLATGKKAPRTVEAEPKDVNYRNLGFVCTEMDNRECGVIEYHRKLQKFEI